MSYFDHTVVVNQPSLKENDFLCHGNLLGCCSWLELKFRKMNVVCSAWSSNRLHVCDGFGPHGPASAAGVNRDVGRPPRRATREHGWGRTPYLQPLRQKSAVFPWGISNSEEKEKKTREKLGL